MAPDGVPLGSGGAGTGHLRAPRAAAGKTRSKTKLAWFSRFLLTSYFFILIPYDEENVFFFLVLVLEDLVGLHRTSQLQLLQH